MDKLSFFSKLSLVGAIFFSTACETSVYKGSKMVQQPLMEVSEENPVVWLDECNGRICSSAKDLDLNHSDTVDIKGWAVDLNNRTNFSQIILRVGEKYIEANNEIKREDVKAFHATDTDVLGFEFAFSSELLKDELGKIVDTLEIIAVNKENKQLQPIKYALLKESSIPNLPYRDLDYAFAEGGIWIDSYLEGVNTINISDVDNPVTVLFGWAFDQETKSGFNNVYAKFGEHAFEGKIMERNDVQNAFQLNDNMVGFIIEVPTYLLKSDEKDLVINGVNKTYTYIFSKNFIIKKD